MTNEALIEAARAAMARAYAPYSHFQVGAALLCADGKVFCGANIESASYGATLCAERVAFSAAVFEGERDFTAIAVVGGNGGKITAECAPCGICRQVMAVLCAPDFKILLTDGKAVSVHTLGELLPLAFNKESLKNEQ
jgi:cytidine deaminase